MNTFHTIIQKMLIFSFVLCFSFVALYIPQQPLSKVEIVEAGNRSTETTQWINMGLLAAQRSLQVALQYFANQLNIKEFILDPLAWLAAKAILANITNSVVSWVNSGFNGAPMFVQDIERYMTSFSDRLANEFVQEIGVANYISDPFRFDIQKAFAEAYQQARSGAPRQTPVAAADMTNKLSSFYDGNFGNDGWDTWFRVSTQSNTYTPYGSLMANQEEASLRMLAAHDSEKRLLSYGDGFISNKICNMINIGGVNRQKCAVSTPGQVISEALNLQLGSGVESLIVADEISEVIVSLFYQIGQTALSGAGGLLGLSGGTGYTELTLEGNIYADQMQEEQRTETGDLVNVGTKMITDALAIENKYLAMVNIFEAAYQNIGHNSLNTTLATIQNTQAAIKTNIDALNDIESALNGPNPDISQLLSTFNSLTLHTETNILESEKTWTEATSFAITDTHNRLTLFENTAVTIANQLQATGEPDKVALANVIRDTTIKDIRITLTNLAENGLKESYLEGSRTGTATMQAIIPLYIPTQSETNALIADWQAVLNS